MVRDIRKILRDATGAAPPSEFDGGNTEVPFTFVDASGMTFSATTKLTYKKFMAADALWR